MSLTRVAYCIPRPCRLSYRPTSAHYYCDYQSPLLSMPICRHYCDLYSGCTESCLYNQWHQSHHNDTFGIPSVYTLYPWTACLHGWLQPQFPQGLFQKLSSCGGGGHLERGGQRDCQLAFVSMRWGGGSKLRIAIVKSTSAPGMPIHDFSPPYTIIYLRFSIWHNNNIIMGSSALSFLFVANIPIHMTQMCRYISLKELWSRRDVCYIQNGDDKSYNIVPYLPLTSQ